MTKKNLLFFLVIGLIVFFFLLIFTSGQHYLPHDGNKEYANYEPFGEMTQVPTVLLRSEIDQSTNVTTQPPEANADFVPYSSDKVQHSSVDSSEIIDPISNAATNKAEGNVCTELTNSRGVICLKPEVAELLKTRGGNATGK